MSGIGTNMAMLVGRQGFMRSQAAMERALERLATGKRINRASDDPSGLIAADALGARRVTLEDMIKRSERVSRMLDIADGAYAEIETLAQELGGLVVSAANRSGTTGAEREAMQIEANSIVGTMVHIIQNTTHDGKLLLNDGAGAEFNGQWITLNAMDPETLGQTTIQVLDPQTGDPRAETYTLHDLRNGPLNLLDGDMEKAQKVVKAFIDTVAQRRAHIGAQQKYTYGHQLDALRTEHENTTAAESAIRDADFAQETSNLIRGQVLREASMAVMKLGQQQAWKALGLLG
jgi:flagellin